MKQHITGCIFDLDGTLADTAPDIAIALNHALSAVGLTRLSLEETVGMIGNGIPALVRMALDHLNEGTERAKDVIDIMMSYYAENYCEGSNLMPGVESCLEGLDQRGVPMAICTNKEEDLAKKVTAALGIESYFKAVVGGRSGLVKKPDPSMLRIAAAAINSSPESTMMVGDSEVDAATGAAAKSVTVIVRGGYCHKPYEALHVNHIIETMDGLLEILDQQYSG